MFSSFSFNCILRDDIVSCNVSISCLVLTDVHSDISQIHNTIFKLDHTLHYTTGRVWDTDVDVIESIE